ncbi:MAG: hypothetical protein IJX99_07350 [Clostridia bacterium]|nr:hypothetical protein [Clostridia bacterium]
MARQGSIRVYDGIMVEEEVANVQPSNLRKSELSFALRTDPEVCEKVIRDLKGAIPNIQGLMDQLKRLKINRNLEGEFSRLKWRLCKYEIMQCDCSWQDKDSELRDALAMLDMCYRTLIHKTEMELNDVFYMRDVTKALLETFEHKIAQLQELLTV